MMTTMCLCKSICHILIRRNRYHFPHGLYSLTLALHSPLYCIYWIFTTCSWELECLQEPMNKLVNMQYRQTLRMKKKELLDTRQMLSLKWRSNLHVSGKCRTSLQRKLGKTVVHWKHDKSRRNLNACWCY